MKSSIFVAVTGAALALANPLDKRVLETEVVVEYYTVTVTGNAPAPTTTATPTTTVKATPSNIKVRPHTQPAQNDPPVEHQNPTTVVIVTVTPEANPKPEPTTAVQVPATTVQDKPAETIAAPSDNGFESTALYHHNIHRSNHSSPEMSWNSEIAGYAANTASTCKFAHDMDQGRGGYGQNIALWGVSSGAEALGKAGAVKMAATNMWYDGEFASFLPSYYGQDTPDMGNFEAWGHLSQLVWADSTGLGCAVQFCPRGTAYDTLDAWFTVCNYSPPGNVGGAYAKNINRPKGDASVSV